MKLTASTAIALLLAALFAAYLPDLGHGFIRDDFMWVRAGHLATPADLLRIAADNTGFYRPLVTLSFGVDRLLFGLHPLPYALTNLALLLACAALVGRLGARLGLGGSAAIAAGAIWAFNVHAVNMALLWLSGRTALLLCLFALLAALASLRRAWWVTGLWCLAALLSKEEAVTLPFVLVGWAWYTTRTDRGPALPTIARTAIPMILALAAYTALRVNSGAFGPANAPSYYQFTFAPQAVGRNILEYTDRACTFAVLTALLAIGATRTLPRLDPATRTSDRYILTFAVFWTMAAYAVTVFLPLRSSLYALCPSIGSALAAGWVLQRLSESAPSRLRRAAVALVVLPFLLLPLYRVRNQRWVRGADESRVLVASLQALAPSIAPGAHLVAVDTPEERLDGVFSGLFNDAVTLFVGKGVTGEIVPPARTGADVPAGYRLRLRADGRFSVSPP